MDRNNTICSSRAERGFRACDSLLTLIVDECIPNLAHPMPTEQGESISFVSPRK